MRFSGISRCPDEDVSFGGPGMTRGDAAYLSFLKCCIEPIGVSIANFPKIMFRLNAEGELQ
jgi:hypothetical protein